MSEQHSVHMQGNLRFLEALLGAKKATLYLSSYQHGQMFQLSTGPDGRFVATATPLPRCMGISATPTSLYVASKEAVHRFDYMMEANPGLLETGHNCALRLNATHHVGRLDTHEMVFHDNQIYFVATQISALCTLSLDHTIQVHWMPPWIKTIAAGDACHFNGVAFDDHGPRWATACGTGDQPGSWRDNRQAGGALVDMRTGEKILTGLSMPHSPRIRENKIWLIDSGNGKFGYADPQNRVFTPVADIPGFGRGLEFIGRYAMIGVSKFRTSSKSDKTVIDNLAIQQKLGSGAKSGLLFVDMVTMKEAAFIDFGDSVDEFFDIKALYGPQNPKIVSFDDPNMGGMMSIRDKRPSADT